MHKKLLTEQQLKKVTKLHYSQFYLGILLLCVLAALVNIDIPEDYLIVGLAIAVTLLGLPHGALDFAVAKSLKLFSTTLHAVYFIVAYSVIAALSIVFWLNFPASALTIFLCVSIYHFSADWRTSMPEYARISLAAIVICGPAMTFSSLVLPLFTALLLSTETAGFLIQGMRVMFCISLLGFLYFLVKMENFNKTFPKWQFAEWMSLLVSSLVFTPLLHFGLYFCLLHSPKHLHDVSKTLNITLTKAIIISVPFVLLTLLLAATLYIGFTSSGNAIEINTALLRWVFIGLFGLTMSHMLLISAWHRVNVGD
ncbi:MAG: Brp/Blh family beta-carotene 15,15'-monooxygenase [Patiriisocius sp.]